MTVPVGVDAALYAQALADVQALRAYGTYRQEPKELRLPTPDPRCGTRTGYARHLRDGEDACAPCKQANTNAAWLLTNTGTTRKDRNKT